MKILVPLPPPSLRRNSYTTKFGAETTLRRGYSQEVYQAWVESMTADPNPPEGGHPWAQVKMTLTWRAAGVLMDLDNVAASCKALIDILRCAQPQDSQDPERYWLGLFLDDGPSCLLELTVRNERVKTRAEEGVVVELERIT